MIALAELVDAIDASRARAREHLRISPLEDRLIRALGSGPRAIGELARTIGERRPSISMAAQRLEARHMVRRETVGRHTVLHLAEDVRRTYHQACGAPLVDGLASWRVGRTDPADVERLTASLLEQLSRSVAETRAHGATSGAADPLHASLRRGDVERSYELAMQLVDGGRTVAAHGAITAALHQVGRDWARGELGVGEERIAVATAARVVDRIAAVVRPPATRATRPLALVCTAEGERHELGTRIVASELERSGWLVDLVPGDVPDEELARVCAARNTDAAFVGITLAEHVDATARLVTRLRRHALVFVGGGALEAPHVAEVLERAGAHRALRLEEIDLASSMLRRARAAA